MRCYDDIPALVLWVVGAAGLLLLAGYAYLFLTRNR